MKPNFIQIYILPHHKNHNHIDQTDYPKLRHIFLMKLKFVNKLPKNETIQYSYGYCRHRPNYINSDHWRNIYIYCPLVLP